MIRTIASLFALASLAGCTLESRMPLLDRSDAAAVVGTYQTMQPYFRDEADKKVPAEERAKCIEPGYKTERSDDSGAPSGETAEVVYCGYSEDDEEPLSVIAIAKRGSDYWADGPEGEAQLRFRARPDGLFLAQLDESKPDDPRFRYYLIRLRGADIEAFPMICGEKQFASVYRANQGQTPTRCRITSFDAIAGEIDAFAAEVVAGKQVPLALLHAIPPR